jgi:hypothetical protein
MLLDRLKAVNQSLTQPPVHSQSESFPVFRKPGLLASQSLALKQHREIELILDSADLDLLWDKLKAVAQTVDNQPCISYTKYQSVRAGLPKKFAPYLTAGIFCHLPKNSDCLVLVLEYFNFVLRLVTLRELRIQLSFYCHAETSYIYEHELEQFIAAESQNFKLEGNAPLI